MMHVKVFHLVEEGGIGPKGKVQTDETHVIATLQLIELITILFLFFLFFFFFFNSL